MLHNKADIVIGSRFVGPHYNRAMYFWHSVGNRFITLVFNMLNNLNLTDIECGYKIFKYSKLVELNLIEKRFGFEPEVLIKFIRKFPQARVFEVPVSYSGRTYEEGKKIGWKDGIEAIYLLFKYRFISKNSL